MRHSVAHNRGVAWLAMLALWLTVLAPVISQTLAATRRISADCHGHAAMAAMPDMAMADMAMPDMAPASMPMPDQPHGAPAGDGMQACGYCGLLGHNPLLFSIAFVAMLLPATPALAAPLPLSSPAPSAPSRVHAPRGPPITRLA